MKTLIATALMLLAVTASTEDAVQPPEPFVLTMFPHFFEMVDNFDTLDECKARGTEVVNSTHIFDGFVCNQARAWIPADKVAVARKDGDWPQGDGS